MIADLIEGFVTNQAGIAERSGEEG